MIQLKDVIHYYIGCDVIVDGKERGRLMGANPIPNSVGQVYWDIITEEMKLEDEDFCMPYNDDPDMGELRIKPILRRMEDIAPEHWDCIEQDIEELTGIDCLNCSKTGVRFNFLDDQRFGWPIVNAALIILRKCGIDMDGLIESGQAIDIKTIPNGQVPTGRP